ncbi:MAG TPA: hypothetical protein VN626_03500 [Clostridia bacterium]|nr:hypothetical protein [Clostridia bacterium]
MKRIGFLVAMLVTALLCVICVLAEEPAAAVIDGTQVFVAEPGEDPRQIESGAESLRTVVKPGSTVYFSIANAVRAEDLNGLRAVVDWSKGEELTGSPRIEYRRMMDTTGQTSLGYRYVVALEILDTADTRPHTLRGSIKIAKRANASAPEVSLTILVRQDGRDNTDRVVTCAQKTLLMEFGRTEEMVRISFFDSGYFEVGVTGQGPLDVGCTTEPVTDIAERYPEAALKFISWSKQPFFNRIGKLVLYAERDSFLYALRGSGLVETTGSYSEEEGGFVLTTRRLEGFVVSDRALDPEAVPVPQSNPPTVAY